MFKYKKIYKCSTLFRVLKNLFNEGQFNIDLIQMTIKLNGKYNKIEKAITFVLIL